MQTEHAYTEEYLNKIRSEVKKRLTANRFAHSERVAEIAVSFASKVGYDESKAELAAVLHDIAREYTDEQLYEIADKYGVRLTHYNRDFPPSIHGKTGAAIAEHEFGITDKEVLMAISNHVSGRPCMKTLEGIVFLADHIDRSRKVFPELVEEVLDKPINEAMYDILGQVIWYDTKNKRDIDERTLQTFDWLLEIIRNEQKSGPTEPDEEKIKSLYNRMDELLSLYAEHVVSGFPAENMRDIGGYRAMDGRTTRRHKIIRSGNPDQFTALDYARLASMGINTIVDLRTDDEKTSRPDLGDSGIRYIDIPLNATNEYKTYMEALLIWYNECDDEEESAWLAARYFNSFDSDSIYIKELEDRDSRKKILKILDIMLSDECTGIMYFCHSGKDRTGIVTAFILTSLGIDPNLILDDYSMSQVPYYAITIKYLNQLKKNDYNLMVRNKVVSVLGVETDLPYRLNQEILQRYGSYQEYFDFENVFGADKLKAFRDKYLE